MLGNGWVNDSPDKIDKCLNCKRTYCNNCLGVDGGGKRIKREEFMQLYETGLSDQRIALELSVGKTTVENYRRALRLKVNKG